MNIELYETFLSDAFLHIKEIDKLANTSDECRRVHRLRHDEKELISEKEMIDNKASCHTCFLDWYEMKNGKIEARHSVYKGKE